MRAATLFPLLCLDWLVFPFHCRDAWYYVRQGYFLHPCLTKLYQFKRGAEVLMGVN